MSKKRFGLGLLAMVLSVLTSPVSAKDMIDVHDEPLLLEPDASSAVVYFVRPSRMGFAIRMWAFVDDTAIGATKGRRYAVTRLKPGKHLIWGSSENVSALELDVAAGKTYYIKLGARMGALRARIKLIPLDEAEGKAALAKCKYATLNEAGIDRGKELVAEKYSRAQEMVAEQASPPKQTEPEKPSVYDY